MYNYGSEARNIEETKAFEGSSVKVSREQKRKALMNKRVEEMKRSALKSLVVIALLLTVVMAREAKIDQLCGQISAKEATLKNVSAVITEKEMQLTGKMDLNMIEEIAVTRLGMKKPDRILEIDVAREDGGEILTEDATVNSGFTAFINKTKTLLEYLY
ncbi:MAG: hypothetical protein ACI3XA_07815 [Clostridia bacterium]